MEQLTVPAKIQCPVHGQQLPAPPLGMQGPTTGTAPTSPIQHMNSALSPLGSPGHQPAEQPELARSILIHDNSQRERDRTEQERPNGEGQVEHLILGIAGRPFVL